MTLYIYYLLSFIMILAALMIVIVRNPIQAVLYLIVVFLGATGILILLEAEFLAMVFLIIYVGAVAVLFLFVIMMMQIKISDVRESLVRYLPLSVVITGIFVLELLYLTKNNFPLHIKGETSVNWVDKMEEKTNVEAFSSIYTLYVDDFILAGLILLLALVGVIAVTLEVSVNEKKQEIYLQVIRDLEAIRKIRMKKE